MTPEERRAYEEKRNKQRLTMWEREAEEMTPEELSKTIDDYQKGIEQYRVQLRNGTPSRQTDLQAVERVEQMIWFLEQKIDIGRRALERRRKAASGNL